MSNVCQWGKVCYQGLEIGNTDRTLGYISRAKSDGLMCCISRCPATPSGCPADWQGCNYSYPSNPGDPAPWYDPLVKESNFFYGIIIDTITGLDSIPFSRSLNNGRLGSVQHLGRRLDFQGTLFAATPESAAYGKQWFSNACNADPGDSCGFGSLTYRKFCPDGDCSDPGTFYDNGIRTLHSVGLVEAPTFTPVFQTNTARKGTGCSDCHITIQRVQWSMHAEDYRMFLDSQSGTPIRYWSLGTPKCVEWCKPEPVIDPLCEPPSDKSPAAWGPPCDFCREFECSCDYSNVNSSSPGWCEPMTVIDRWGTIPGQPMWLGSSSKVTIKAGSKDIRNLRIAAFSNRNGDDCAKDFDLGLIAPTAVMEIPYLCAGTTLEVDGSNQNVTIKSPGIVQRGDAYVYGENGGAFSWLTPGCDPMCVLVRADSEHISAEMEVLVESVPFEVA